MAETYLFDGDDVLDLAWIASYEGQFDVPELRGEDLVIPTVSGVTALDRPYGVSTLTLELEVIQDSLATRNDAMRALARLFKLGQVVTITRRRDFTGGTEEHTAPCRYLSGLSPAWIETAAARLAVTFTVLSGYWQGDSVAASPGTLTVDGDAPTQASSIDFPGAGVLTNTTTDSVMSSPGAVTLSPTGFRLLPGSNTVTWSGSGTPSISYKPAYT